jgi:hypothetical protein
MGRRPKTWPLTGSGLVVVVADDRLAVRRQAAREVRQVAACESSVSVSYDWTYDWTLGALQGAHPTDAFILEFCMGRGLEATTVPAEKAEQEEKVVWLCSV